MICKSVVHPDKIMFVFCSVAKCWGSIKVSVRMSSLEVLIITSCTLLCERMVLTSSRTDAHLYHVRTKNCIHFHIN